MKKIDPTVRSETIYVGGVVLILSVLMEAVFLIIRQWDYTVLLGNILGGGAAVLNFLLMGITVQKAIEKDEKGAATAMKASQSLRMLLLFVIGLLAALLPCFNLFAALIPFFFPRIAVTCRPLLDKLSDKKQKGAD